MLERADEKYAGLCRLSASLIKNSRAASDICYETRPLENILQPSGITILHDEVIDDSPQRKTKFPGTLSFHKPSPLRSKGKRRIYGLSEIGKKPPEKNTGWNFRKKYLIK